ncbi:MAG: sensor histidine kinase [Gaiellaceae bacterium]
MHTAVQTLRDLNIVAYTALGGVALLLWRQRRDRAAMWAAGAFSVLAAVELLSLIPNHAGDRVEAGVVRVEILLLVLFPYVLFRFTGAFRSPGRRLANALVLLTMVLSAWTFALGTIPRAGEHWQPAFAGFVAVFVVHWVLLSVVSAVRLWRAGAGQPTVARRRMRFMATGAGALTLALVLAAGTGNKGSALALGSQGLATLSVFTFLIGFSPPLLLRIAWRRVEQERVQQAIQRLLSFAESQEEVAGRVLEPTAAIVGARALAIRNAEGRIVASWNEDGGDSPNAEAVDVEFEGGKLTAWTSPYAPFFGDEELALLQTVGALIGVALDRVRLYQAEHDTRLALERANEMKLDFIALAAHELRTPMTTIHGFVQTLHHLGRELPDEQRRQVDDALLQQTDRMARLVEQLLDLSRLDAEAIEISPRPIALRPHLEEIVAAAAPDPSSVEIDVAEKTIATVDRNALDRIVSNLITNAFRYGTPPVVVSAQQTDRHFRLSVEDRGSGVPPEFVPDLFERFSRSKGARDAPGGTGLGLAIARSYARAHGGDLLYEDAQPHGARFQLVLPSHR